MLYVSLASRALDDIEETRLVPEQKVLYQFSARGHEMAQVILGSLLDHPHDAVGAYYRSRPMLLTLGLSLEDAFAAPMGKSGGFSNGRDIGVVCNLPKADGPIVLPMSGDVGSQYTPAVGWAQGVTYHRDVLGDRGYDGSIAVVLGGEASVATNGFWSALTIATTLTLPLLFYIEDNGYGISVPSSFQTPGGNIAANLASFRNLLVRNGDGSEPSEAARLLQETVAHVRAGQGPRLAPARRAAVERAFGARIPRRTRARSGWPRSRRAIRCPSCIELLRRRGAVGVGHRGGRGAGQGGRGRGPRSRARRGRSPSRPT